MTELILNDAILLPQTSLSPLPKGMRLSLPATGGGVLLPVIATRSERYLVFFAQAHEEHSVASNLHVYTRDAPEGPARFTIRFGLLPALRTLVCLDLNWMDGHVLFPEANEGQLKVVCHGARVSRDEICRVTLDNSPCFHALDLSLEEVVLTDTKPTSFPVPELKLVDEWGQSKSKDWPRKVRSVADLRQRLQTAQGLTDAYPFSEWDRFGGHSGLKLTEGTGFFTKIKKNGRWWLADPLGNAFFSVGPDCAGVPVDCRVDGVEACLDWLPDRSDPDYGSMFRTVAWPLGEEGRRRPLLFSYEQANLHRAFGPQWPENWNNLMRRQLKNHGLNSLGNWSDPETCRALGLPYVTQLPEFPSTAQLIFRDFPDVLSPEYSQNAEVCARALLTRRDDPLVIGVFLRNEPAWAFVDHLILADEVLLQSAPTVCKERLIASLAAQYESIAALNVAWQTRFSSFDALRSPLRQASRSSAQAERDLRAFSRTMLEAYVGVPAEACRRIDPNHLILGMRWAWIADADMVTGWQHFDVFSINCYATDPTAALDQVVALGVDLPILIGEFHFGALDRGPTATGLEGVQTQADRGAAYRYYTDRVARHPHGVGCHYFQCYDQFVLGRFDGENYNIGLFDVCSQPYPELMNAILACSAGVYDVVAGRRLPVEEAARTIPMIAY